MNDLFAMQIIYKLLIYVSSVPDPMTWKEDAFKHQCGHLGAYALPLFAVICWVISQEMIISDPSTIPLVPL